MDRRRLGRGSVLPESARRHLYDAAASRLFASGNAYYCDCTARGRGRPHEGQRRGPGYDGFCRERGLGPGEGRALRFRTPTEGTTTVVDLIRGEPEFENALIEDFVLVRGNGRAMFLLANVVDDIDMRISHVIRAEEHLPNTPKAILLWVALEGGDLPVFAHVPLLVNEKRQKLSKRRDPVALELYRDEGYLPETMQNFLMLLGWAPPGDQEIMPFADLARLWRLEDVHSSPAYFDVKKLEAFNGEYIRAMTADEFVERSQPWLVAPHAAWHPEQFDRGAFEAMAPFVQTRVTRLSEVPAMVDFVFLDEPAIDPASWEKVMKTETAAPMLDGAIDAYADAPWDADTLKAALEMVGEGVSLKLGKAQAPIRVATTGRTVGPPLFESLVVLGRERTLARLRAARARV